MMPLGFSSRRIRRAPMSPNSPRDSGVGVVMPRAMKPDWVSKSKVRQTMWRGISIGDTNRQDWLYYSRNPHGCHAPASGHPVFTERRDVARRPGVPRPQIARAGGQCMGFSVMATRTIGIILNGATGRICSTQHLKNALVPIRDEGGLTVGDDRIVPRLLLVGRDAGSRRRDRRRALASPTGPPISTRRSPIETSRIFFDAAATHQRDRRPDQGDRGRQAHLYREAGGDCRSPRACGFCAPPRRAASSTAPWRTRSICPACRS